MARKVKIGSQGFEDMRAGGYFYVDKTAFIRDWWRGGDDATLICRPRRFGKTLTLDTVRCFLSLDFAGRGEELFGGLTVWDAPDMRALQGTVPVVSLSFADIKKPDLPSALAEVRQVLSAAVDAHGYLSDSPAINANDRAFLARVSDGMDDVTATTCLKRLCAMLLKHHGVKPVVLLDEYDTPMQEAWLQGYWDGMSTFMRSLLNSTFKTNPSMDRGLITGITRVASESIFSDLNNLSVVTTNTPAFQTAFGFTQPEVDAALDEFGLAGEREAVRDWYDGFTFGGVAGVYNPWSITNFLQNRQIGLYWANTSSNSLVSGLVRRSAPRFKGEFEALLAGGSAVKATEEIVNFRTLEGSEESVWTLLLAAGYLKVVRQVTRIPPREYELALTNREVSLAFDAMVRDWFSPAAGEYNGFARALLAGDARAMTSFLSEVAAACMSSFDSATRPSGAARPERFWHGLVLGLLVELRGRYAVESNRESGFGRYDVMLVPNDGAAGSDPAVILEFKVLDREWDGEESLADTVASALAQIAERGYATALAERGIAPERIHCYGIAFQGKRVLVG